MSDTQQPSSSSAPADEDLQPRDDQSADLLGGVTGDKGHKDESRKAPRRVRA